MKTARILLAAACATALACGNGDDDGVSGGDGGGPRPVDANLGPDAVWEPQVAPEIDGRLVINELMAKNALTIRDEGDQPGDWIELYNPTDQEIPLRGYGVTDDLANPRAGVIHEGVSIAAHATLVLWLDGSPDRGPTHVGVQLAEEGGVVALTRPDGTFIDRVAYGPQTADFAAAREPDGSDVWVIEWLASPGAPNPSGPGAAVGVEDPAAAPEQVPDVGDLSARILGDDVLPEIALEIAPENLDALEADPRTYVQAFIYFDGRRYGPVGVRLKGQNSFQPIYAKPSFRVNMDEFVAGARFFGLKDLTFNNMDDDYSMLHERLGYWAFRQAGLAASRCTHALISVNDVFYGVYANVETVKKQMMARWFADTSGTLFEATDVDFADAYIPRYELEAGPDDRTKLAGLADALELPNADDAITLAGAYADLDAFLTYWAMTAVVGQFDALPYSAPGDDYFVYSDPGTGKLYFLPWGMDETFYSAEFDVFHVASRFATRCLESPACHQAFVDHAWQALATMDSAGMEAERTRLIAEIAPHLTRDVKKPYADATVAEYQQQMYWFVKERRLRFSQQLPAASAP